MCNLYSLKTTRQHIGDLFRVSDNRLGEAPDLPAIFPGHAAPVVRKADDGARECVMLSWGFVMLQPGKAPRRVTNTRDDKISSSFWRKSFADRRCLVPVTSFAEPDSEKPVRWHWFALKGNEPRPLFAFAGLWQRWKGPVKKDGPTVEIDVFSFMTGEPNDFTKAINHERLPILLGTREMQEQWIDGNTEDAVKLLKPYPAERMREVQAGLEKMDSGVD